MRISTGMIYDQSSINITRQYEQLFTLNEQISTGKRINKPSDAPVDVGKVLDYRTLLGSIEQYMKNTERGTTLLQYTESALSSAGDVLTDAKVLAEQMATGSYTEEQRTMLATQADQLYNQLMQISNTKVSGKYIFAGFKTDTTPFTADSNYNAAYHGDNNQIRLTVQQNIQVAVNISGQQAFMDDTNAFDVLRDLRTALRENNQEEIGNILPRIDDAVKQINKFRAYVGTSLSELESSNLILDQFKGNTEALLSNTEDTDVADAVTKLQERQLVFEASLKSTALITQLSLVNFV
jgi:flagellar hook-associated protein 3 FlgL